MMGKLFSDLRYAVRMLMKKPGFSLIAVLTLALGIGANSAIFSIINGVLLNPLRYKDPERLVAVRDTLPQGWGSISAPNFIEYQRQKDIFEDLSAYQWKNFNLASSERPERVIGATVSANFFDVIGVSPLIGRRFQTDEGIAGNELVVILSDKVWRRDFGGSNEIVGKKVLLDGKTYTAIGVMSPDFDYPSQNTEIWVPLVFTAEQLKAVNSNNYQAVGRLKSGVSVEQAQEHMNTVAKRLEEQNPKRAGRGINVTGLQESMTGNVQQTLLILMSAVACVLLIACANVANLLLVNAMSRRKEIAIRSALGAGRLRIIRQFLTESLLLFLMGGIAGLILAKWMLDGLLYLSTGFLPRFNEVKLDSKVIVFTLLSALITGLIFGLIPAIQTARADVQENLNEGGARSGTSHSKLRSAFVVAEIAVALILLIGAGLLIKSFVRLQQTDLGLQTENILTMKLTLPEAKYKTTGEITVFGENLLDKISTNPDIQWAGMINLVPIRETGNNSNLIVQGQPPFPSGEIPLTEIRAIGGDYFKTVGIRLLQGRAYNAQDREKSEPVVIVNQAFVRAQNLGEDAVGRYLENDQKTKIVGVVSDIRESGVDLEPRPIAYFPQSQTGSRTMGLIVRAKSDSSSIIPAIRRDVASIDPSQPIYNVRTMEEIVTQSGWRYRMNTLLLGIFASVAMTLAVIGIYGVMTYTVSQRIQEIGIRMALGAERKNIFAMIIRQGMTVTLIGIFLGLTGAFVLTRLMSSLLYGVTTTDAFTFASVPVLLVLTALASCYLPARRATKVSPLVALRHE